MPPGTLLTCLAAEVAALASNRVAILTNAAANLTITRCVNFLCGFMALSPRCININASLKLLQMQCLIFRLHLPDYCCSYFFAPYGPSVDQAAVRLPDHKWLKRQAALGVSTCAKHRINAASFLSASSALRRSRDSWRSPLGACAGFGNICICRQQASADLHGTRRATRPFHAV